MREIKFRVWDVKKQIFMPSGDIIFSDYGDTRITVNPNCIEYIGDSCHDYYEESRFKVMQYTGLKDKNDVEIYKSDLLKDDKGRIFKVIEDNRIGATGYIMECVKNKSEKDHIKIGNIYNFYSWITPFHCLEVIGNIYEDSHLLDNN